MRYKSHAILLVVALNVIAAGIALAQKGSLRITDKNVGPISKQTPFSKDQIVKLFPDYKILTGTVGNEDEIHPTIEIYAGKTKLLLVTPTVNGKDIYGVAAYGENIVTTDDLYVGMTFSASHQKLEKDSCSAGEEQDSGLVLCRSSKARNITYVFSGKWNGADGQIPPEKVLNSYTIREIRWFPQ